MLRAVAQRIAFPKITLFAVAILLSSCAPTQPPKPPPPGEWKTTRPGAETLGKVVAAHARPWKGIEAGRTTRDKVEARFAPVKTLGEVTSLYRIDQIDAVIIYGAGAKVVSVRMLPASDVRQDQLADRFGKPDSRRELKGGGQALDYDGAGLSVEYAEANAAPIAVELHVPTKPPGSKTAELFEALVPIRPPLSGMPDRVQTVQQALSSTSGGFSWVGREREKTQAETIYSGLESKGLLINPPDLREYTDGLMARLSSVTPEGPFSWNLSIMKGALPNAMNVGGGYVFITQGLFEQFDSEAQLAYVVSHEIAHQLKGDVAAQQTRGELASILVLAAAIAAGAATGSADVMRATMDIGQAAAGVALVPFSREQETNADIIAMDIVEAAGYDPRQAATVMGRFKAVRDKYGTEIGVLSTHPTIESREADVKAWLDSHASKDYSMALVTTQEFISVRSRYRLNPW